MSSSVAVEVLQEIYLNKFCTLNVVGKILN